MTVVQQRSSRCGRTTPQGTKPKQSRPSYHGAPSTRIHLPRRDAPVDFADGQSRRVCTCGQMRAGRNDAELDGWFDRHRRGLPEPEAKPEPRRGCLRRLWLRVSAEASLVCAKRRTSGEEVILYRRRRELRAGWWNPDRGKWSPTISGGAGLTLNWKGTTATWGTASNWVDQATGVAALAAPTNADLCRFGVGTGATNNACTTSAGDVCGELSVANGYTGTLTLANSNTALSVGGAALGAVTLGTGMTLTNGGINARLVCVATSNNGGAGFAFTSAGKAIGQVRFSGVGGSWVLQDDLTVSGNVTSAFAVIGGTLNTNGKTVTVSAAGGTATFGGGTLTTGASTFNFATTAAATFWSVTTTTVNGTGSTIVLTAASANTRTFAGGSQTYGTLTYTVAASTGQLTVTGSNTFAAINFNDTSSVRTLQLAAGTTTTITGPNGLGGVGRFGGAVMTLKSGTGGTAATVNLSSLTVSIMRNVTVQDISVFPAGHLYALDGSTSTSGNTGITFNTPFGWGVAA